MVMPEAKQAPGQLKLVQGFVNTLDLEDGTDDLSSPQALAGWLSTHGLARPDARVTRGDLGRALALREALRASLRANTDGAPTPPDACAAIDQAAERARLLPRLLSDGGTALEPKSSGVDAALGRLLAIVHESIADGTWARMKACRNESCQWAFYDHTKNRSGAWCTMAVCGNRTKARVYRARRAQGLAPGGAGGVEKRAG